MCPETIEPPAETNLQLMNYENGSVPVGSNLQFGCKNTMKFNNSFTQEIVNVTCNGGTNYSLPDVWDVCVDGMLSTIYMWPY